jgi:hypothetical protein
MIMIPVLILQIFLFPLSASWLMNTWVNQRRALALQDAASNIGSTIQQTYFSLNHVTIPNGTKTSNLFRLPQSIDGYCYVGNAVLFPTSGAQGSAQRLEITLRLVNINFAADTSVVLGSNARWSQTANFTSTSPDASVCAQKSSDGTTIEMHFGG